MAFYLLVVPFLLYLDVNGFEFPCGKWFSFAKIRWQQTNPVYEYIQHRVRRTKSSRILAAIVRKKDKADKLWTNWKETKSWMKIFWKYRLKGSTDCIGPQIERCLNKDSEKLPLNSICWNPALCFEIQLEKYYEKMWQMCLLSSIEWFWKLFNFWMNNKTSSQSSDMR